MLHHAIQACAAGDKIKVGIDPVEHEAGSAEHGTEDDEDTKSHPPKILSSSTAYVGRHADEREVRKTILDLIVCKISLTTANPFSKMILATIKINRPESELGHACEQFGRCPESVEGYRHHKELHSYLLISHRYLGIRFYKRFLRSVHRRSGNLTAKLCELAIKYYILDRFARSL